MHSTVSRLSSITHTNRYIIQLGILNDLLDVSPLPEHIVIVE
jgi:hypothetical protein